MNPHFGQLFAKHTPNSLGQGCVFVVTEVQFEILPGSILARVKRVESLATKQDENNSAASFP